MRSYMPYLVLGFCSLSVSATTYAGVKKTDAPVSSLTLKLVDADFAVSGRVTDEKGEPLAGVSIKEQGTSKGTVTDVGGNYTIRVTDKSAVLTFDYIGFNSKRYLYRATVLLM